MRHQPTTAPTAVLAQSHGFPRPLFSTSLPQSHNVYFCLLTHQALNCPRKRCYTSPASQSLLARHSNPLPLIHPHRAASSPRFASSILEDVNSFFKNHLQSLMSSSHSLSNIQAVPHWYPSTPIFSGLDWAILRKMHSTSVWQHPSRPQVQVFKLILAK
ncbi:hypothetical protein B0H14DRAFT_2667874 [Mycena olivaceomarginata]|nr:hypothetical protein B0H14DRAFT_2667874 [Mycena olivaceomarginata]